MNIGTGLNSTDLRIDDNVWVVDEDDGLSEPLSPPTNQNPDTRGCDYMVRNSKQITKVHDCHFGPWCWICNKVIQLYRKVFPYGYINEMKEILKLAWPVVGMTLLQLMQFCVSIVFCGHLGKLQLSAAALINTVINVAGVSIITGLSSACDTLFTQTYGSPNKDKIGVIVQKAVLILGLACLPCCAVLLNAEHVMISLGQHPAVSRLGGQYATVFILGLPGIALSVILQKYLQAQSIVLPSLIIGILINMLNAILHALFIFGLQMGIRGAAFAVVLTQWSTALLHWGYIYFRGVYRLTWTGWSRECLDNWKVFLCLALPGVLMVCLEWWSFEILLFIVGYLGETDLSAFAVIYNLAILSYMIPLGISVAAGVRVGNHLGAAKPNMAMTCSRVAITVAWFSGLVNMVFLLTLRDYLPWIFTDDRDVVELASSIMPQLALFSFGDFTQSTASGVLRGMGHQKFGAITNVIAYYGVAYTFSLPLMLKTDLRVAGAWWGMCVCVLFQSAMFLVKIGLIDWESESEKAQVRSGALPEDLPFTRGHSIPHVVFADDAISITNDTQELMEADHLTISDTCSRRSDEVDENKCESKLHTIFLSRFAILFSFLIILAIGILFRLYLDSKNIKLIPECFLIDRNSLNRTFIRQELFGNTSVSLSEFESTLLNLTYWFEAENHWNETFLYCNGVIKSLTSHISVDYYHHPWIFNGVHSS